MQRASAKNVNRYKNMTKTLTNLVQAYLGECQARNRYTFYAKVAKKEGYEQIAGIFMETAEQEKVHAKRLFEHIQEIKMGATSLELEKVEVPLAYGTTKENLVAAIEGETYEYNEMYPGFAKIAKEEGLDKIAVRLSSIAKAEAHHAERYQKALNLLETDTVFKKENKVVWVCRECGYIHEGTDAPGICPSCDHPQAYYQMQSENY